MKSIVIYNLPMIFLGIPEHLRRKCEVLRGRAVESVKKLETFRDLKNLGDSENVGYVQRGQWSQCKLLHSRHKDTVEEFTIYVCGMRRVCGHRRKVSDEVGVVLSENNRSFQKLMH